MYVAVSETLAEISRLRERVGVELLRGHCKVEVAVWDLYTHSKALPTEYISF